LPNMFPSRQEWRAAPSMPQRTRRIILYRAVFSLLTLVLLDFAASVLWLGAAVVTERQDQDGEAIAVLWSGEDTHLSSEGERRVRQALAIWQDGEPSRLIFCIGGNRPALEFSGARLTCELLADSGVPVEKLRTDTGSNDTVSNLHEIGSLARSTRIRRVLVVCDPLQAMRIRFFLQRLADPAVLEWAPYEYRATLSLGEVVQLWTRVQYEFIAVASLLIPQSIRKPLIDRLRR
jgi:uncharacterized SAM-binding protein YcdF (DUF218 family)